jgi:hypothetical protein
MLQVAAALAQPANAIITNDRDIQRVWETNVFLLSNLATWYPIVNQRYRFLIITGRLVSEMATELWLLMMTFFVWFENIYDTWFNLKLHII